jgi:hypothetical protein
MLSSWLLKIFQQAIRCNMPENIMKNMTNLGCDLMDMWRRPASTGTRIQTCPNCRIYMGELAHKSNSEFNSSPIQNLGEADLKTEALVAHDI